MQVFLSLQTPADRGRFLHAMLGLVNLEGEDAASQTTVESALVASELGRPETAAADLVTLNEQAHELGVTTVPTMYRHGPAVAVGMNGAAISGDLERRARVILDMLDDDGLWSLGKP